jgi:crotonobetainyl-CoA:carnitine CoA-transferase CaiB-like acyl-CoA transferase
VGFRGPEANRPGYDGSVFWARGGNCYAYTRPGEQPTSPRPAYGDHTGSIALAYGIAAALFRRATTGEPSVVENSLLSTSCWVLSGDLTQTQLPQYQTHPDKPIRRPLTYSYATRDGRRVQLMILNPQPRWKALCGILGLEDIVEDPRFATDQARNADPDPLIALMQEKFAQRDYAEWRPLLEAIDIPWEPVNTLADVVQDPQVHANAMMQKMDVDGQAIDIIAGPVAFDGQPIAVVPKASPVMGEHTEELLSEVGYASEVIADMRERNVAR